MLVLNPGTSASAAYFKPLARLRRSTERRLAGVGGRAAREPARGPVGARPSQAGQGDDAAALRLLPRLPHRPERHQPLPADPRRRRSPFARQWGMATEIDDLRRVVEAAGKRGRQGRARRPLARRLDHHRLRDLGLQRQAGRQGPLRPRLHRRRQQPRRRSRPSRPTSRSPTCSRARPGSPSAASPAPFAGLFNVDRLATAPSRPERPSLGYSRSRCCRPTSSRRSRRPTRAQYGFALDTETSPPALAAAQAHLGHLAASGDPRGWDDAGELTPVDRFAKMFSGTGVLRPSTAPPGTTRCG